MEIIGAAIVICIFISLYSLFIALKVSKAIMWILTHVHVVSKSNQKDPELAQIKRTFGVEEGDNPGK